MGQEVGQGLGGGWGSKEDKGNKGVYRLRIGSWNVGTLTGKSIELAKILQKRRFNIVCLQETRECTINIVSAYAPHAGLDEEVKRHFWEGLDEIVCHILPAEQLFIGGDFNGHIGSTVGGYGMVHGGFSYGERNG
ncbi:uncharacterized protein [Nicotiana sylvestris]|uniref:uncharacterized protein n=1 Tax=Nicotiana sylvestris TaxID=4096 RepID=UPI00388C75C2